MGDYGAGHVCGRAVKDEGLCGIYLAAKRRREANTTEWNLKSARETAQYAAAEKLVKCFKNLSITAHAWSSGVKLLGADATAVLERLGQS